MASSSLPLDPSREVQLMVCATKANSRNQFLNLSPELRNKIYEYSLYVGEAWLVSEARIKVKKKYDEQQHNTTATTLPTPPSVLSFLLTCRQIRNEAEAIFYAINNLNMNIRQREYLIEFRAATKDFQRRQRFIEKLTVYAQAPVHLGELLAELFAMTNLQTLGLHVAYNPNWFTEDGVPFNRLFAQSSINSLPKLKELSITMTGIHAFDKRHTEVEAEIRAIIDDRDNAMTKRDAVTSGK